MPVVFKRKESGGPKGSKSPSPSSVEVGEEKQPSTV